MPARTRGLYAATTVAPPTRVESTNTFPPRFSFMNSTVARLGSRAAAREAIARVAAAAASSVGSSSIGTTTWRPFAPLVFTPDSRPASVSTCRTSRATETTIGNPLPSGGSRSSTRCVARSSRSRRTSVGWYSTARWLANHSNVRRSLHSAYATSRFDASAHKRSVGTHSGVYFGTFFCMNALLTAVDADHREWPVAQLGQDAVGHRVQVVDEIALGRASPVEQRLIEVRERDAFPFLTGGHPSFLT